MRTSFLLIMVLAVAAIALTPTAMLAQSDGCPWCTTPTTCSEVEENTTVGGCYNIGAGCRTIAGSCTLEEQRLHELLVLNRIKNRGTEHVEIWGTKFNLRALPNGLYAEWACDGRIASLFRMADDKSWVEVDPAPYQSRYSFSGGIGPIDGHTPTMASTILGVSN